MVSDYIYPMMQGISTAIAIVRLEMDHSTYNVDNEALKAVMNFAAPNNNDNPSP